MTLAEAELDRLMARLAQGDRQAFAPLYAELSPRALRYAQRRLPAADAQDAAQNALMKIFSHASRFTSGRALLPWFYAVLLNEVRAMMRKRGNAVGLQEVMEPASDALDAHEQLQEQQMHARLTEAIDLLDAPSREAILERLDGAHASAQQVALRKRLSRAYARLRELMGVDDEN